MMATMSHRLMPIKVTYSPRKQVIIHEIASFRTTEEMAAFLTAAIPSPRFPPVYWVEGVVMAFTPLPFTDSVSKEIIQGRLHWDHVSCAPMPTYQNNINIPGRGTVTVLNVSHNETFVAIGKFLHKKIRSK